VSNEKPIVADLGRPETPEETAARKAESSRRHRDSTTVRNLLIALGVSLGLVLFTVLVVVRPDQPPRESVDYASIAAESTADAPLAVPSLSSDWTANRAVVETGGDGIQAWNIGFITPKNQFIAMTQGIDANPSWVSAKLGTLAATGTDTIAGIEWTLYDNREGDNPGNKAYAMVGEIAGSTYVLNGTAETPEFETLAEALN